MCAASTEAQGSLQAAWGLLTSLEACCGDFCVAAVAAAAVVLSVVVQVYSLLTYCNSFLQMRQSLLLLLLLMLLLLWCWVLLC